MHVAWLFRQVNSGDGYYFIEPCFESFESESSSTWNGTNILNKYYFIVPNVCF